MAPLLWPDTSPSHHHRCLLCQQDPFQGPQAQVIITGTLTCNKHHAPKRASHFLILTQNKSISRNTLGKRWHSAAGSCNALVPAHWRGLHQSHLLTCVCPVINGTTPLGHSHTGNYVTHLTPCQETTGVGRPGSGTLLRCPDRPKQMAPLAFCRNGSPSTLDSAAPAPPLHKVWYWEGQGETSTSLRRKARAWLREGTGTVRRAEAWHPRR